MKALLFDTGLRKFVNVCGLKDLQTLVGGYIEAVYLEPNIIGYINEEGKLLGLPINFPASRLCLDNKIIHKDDMIFGPMVITGVGKEGEIVDIPMDYANSILPEPVI